MSDRVANYKKYGSEINTIDVLKFVAIALMVVDHIGAFLMDDNVWLRSIGRASFPIWGFLAGYSISNKSFKEILLWAIALQLFLTYVLEVSSIWHLNIFFTILICKIYCLYLRKKNFNGEQLILIFAALLLWSIPAMYLFEYGSAALMLALCGLLQRQSPGQKQTRMAFIMTTIFYVLYQCIGFTLQLLPLLLSITFVLTVIHYLGQFSFKTIQDDSSALFKNIFLFISRNSLYIYVVHVVLFLTLAKFL